MNHCDRQAAFRHLFQHAGPEAGAPVQGQARGKGVGSFLILLLFLWSAAQVSADVYHWKSVTIKGGGFVSGIIMHPNAPGVAYCRTDIGGAYRWNSVSNSWTPLLDFAADANPYGVESIAIDPSDSNRVYIAASRNAPNGTGLKFIFASTNQGATFASFTPPFELDGNFDGRSAGERLAVDPNSNNILYYGSRENGLYKSVNFGANWSAVGSFPVTTTPNGVGLAFIEFIQSSGTNGNATPTIFVGVSRGGMNLYRSADGGVNWTNISASDTSTMLAHHAAQDGLGNMFVTYNNNQGPNNITTGRVHRINLATLVVTNVSPAIPAGAQGGFAGVSVDRQNPTTLVVSTMDRWWAPPPLPEWDTIYRSTNSGQSWVVAGPTTLPASTSAPWSVGRNPHWAGDIEIDPFNSDRALFVTGYGIIGTTNLTSPSVNWAFMSDGIEETVPLGLASPPSGPFLLSGHGDIGGFRHNNLEVSPPLADYFSTHRVTSLGIDFAENNPNRIVRLFSGAPHGAYSANGGTSWQDFANIPAGVTGDNRGNVAISADGGRVVWIPDNAVAYFSTNNGVNWTASTGGPGASSSISVPVADRVNSNKFYIYASGGGGTARLYISTNGGATFGTNAPITSGNEPRTVFGREGHIWLPRGGSGLMRSTNSGTTLTTVSTVQQATYVSFGAIAPGQSYPAVFILGRVAGVDGIYRSDDEGISWTRLNDAQHQFGLSWIHAFCADPRVYGRVYFGTEGRGIIYGELQSPPSVPTILLALAGDSQVALNWTTSPGATNYYVKRSTISGGSYATVATNSSVALTNTGLNNGTVYYYVVSALGASGTSANSTEASARPIASNPTEVSIAAIANNQFQLAWPADHTGWWLQMQTNPPGVGIGTNWMTVSASDQTNVFNVPLDPANGSVFFRLIHP